ncbi:hypothetical protein [uncultured Methylobacterium sp.]|uniref:hypothetical protein n=1 Tax=uncultured Methylobacterium sp. TaxID=157278 RepID=UPI0035CC9360
MSKRKTNDAGAHDARPEPDFTPFADASTVRTVGALSFENGPDAITLHGSLDLTRDRAGLDRARAVKVTLDAIVEALTRAELPEAVAETAAPPAQVKNPFA